MRELLIILAAIALILVLIFVWWIHNEPTDFDDDHRQQR